MTTKLHHYNEITEIKIKLNINLIKKKKKM